MAAEKVLVRPYTPGDAQAVRDIFVSVNCEIAPERLKTAFQAYVSLSLANELDRIDDYYTHRGGAFWVAERGTMLAGMFGVEPVTPGKAELRRMYVAPEMRRRGLASSLLRHAEDWAKRAGFRKMALATSELQGAALRLYLSSGYALVREESADQMTVKTAGAGLRRFFLEKDL